MLSEYFPDALPVEDYVKRTHAALVPYGLASDKTLALVGLCRDELTGALSEPIQATWGRPFSIGSLAGILLLGTTGLRAGMAHAPDGDGRARYVIYAMPHVGIDSTGAVGFVDRPGQGRRTTACGALLAFRNQLAEGSAVRDLDPDDIEMSLLRGRLLRAIPDGTVPGVAELTRIAARVALEDLLHLAAQIPDWADADVAVFTGVEIHTPAGEFVAPVHSSIRLAGDREPTLLDL